MHMIPRGAGVFQLTTNSKLFTLYFADACAYYYYQKLHIDSDMLYHAQIGRMVKVWLQLTYIQARVVFRIKRCLA